ncbi:hypothetical protein [Streptomonospora litoralis]|uniref:Uncharacterized protein n=1 Tax=Streptomonospora litoralis TaxID=2498135 RepID=A0A4P6Q966_9ACTN|nr:hypothetical protein [Streptomonospora litoralis]QBI55869.1 hypothetical protein EKD16_20550 [Streptomonospora litoralis]
MTPHRRKAVCIAVLVPAALITLGYGFEWGYRFPLAGVAGGVVMLAAVWLTVYAVLPGIHSRSGLPAVFVLGWGVVVLAAALGSAAAAVTGNELMRYNQPTAFPQDDESSFGWFAYEQPRAYSGGLLVQDLYVEGSSSAFTSVDSVVPSGTSADALIAGWLAGGAGAFVYSRTRPREAGAGAGAAEAEPAGASGGGETGGEERPKPPRCPEQAAGDADRPGGADAERGGTVGGRDGGEGTGDAEGPGGRPGPGES